MKISANFWVCDFGQNLKMTKTKTKTKNLLIRQENTCKSSLHLNLIILTDFHSFAVNEDKLENQSIWRFLIISGYAILVKIWKWLKLLNSLPFIKKTLVNQVYIEIWSSWQTFTVLQWMKKNSKSSLIFKFFAKVWVCDLGQHLIMTKMC